MPRIHNEVLYEIINNKILWVVKIMILDVDAHIIEIDMIII